MTLFHNDEFAPPGSNNKEGTARELVGYCEREEGMYPVYAAARGSIVTQAFILCKYCHNAVSANSGPRYDVMCLPCYELDPQAREILANEVEKRLKAKIG